MAATHEPDALTSLRDSFALHLTATRTSKSTHLYLTALDSLIRHLQVHEMPTTARAVRQEHLANWLLAMIRERFTVSAPPGQ